MPVPTSTSLDSIDPLAKVLEPPPDETSTERDARLSAEAKARRISEGIDEELEKEKRAENKGAKPLKMLLLGQSESGKSTTLKNLQLLYDPKMFSQERASWKAVIHLNIVRSVHLILNTIAQARTESQTDADRTETLSPELLKLQLRLTPLLQIEQALIGRLAPEAKGAQLHDPSSLGDKSNSDFDKEVAINSTLAWKEALARPRQTDEATDMKDSNDPVIILNACSQDMQLLWNDSAVRALLKEKNILMEDVAGFFLDSLDRITAPGYIPSDDDVLRARLKTLGVSEHRFKIKPAQGPTRDWRVFDVGGHRSLRAAWVPYFDDMDAIIFLAPISAFDQTLAEEPATNRLEDSVNIWNYIVKNELLKNTQLILFMNKIDILKAKLQSGIMFSDYVVSYGARRERENDVKSVTKYLKEKFSGILREKSLISRPFYCHMTTVTNIQSTQEILTRVRDVLMRKHLEDADLI